MDASDRHGDRLYIEVTALVRTRRRERVPLGTEEPPAARRPAARPDSPARPGAAGCAKVQPAREVSNRFVNP